LVPLLLSNGADPNEVVENVDEEGNEYEDMTPYRRTPFIEAAARGHLDTVQLLLSHGADLNRVDSSGMTAFDVSEQNQRVEVHRFLQTRYLLFVLWLRRYRTGNLN